jgi:hypothetical protein
MQLKLTHLKGFFYSLFYSISMTTDKYKDTKCIPACTKLTDALFSHYYQLRIIIEKNLELKIDNNYDDNSDTNKDTRSSPSLINTHLKNE